MANIAAESAESPMLASFGDASHPQAGSLRAQTLLVDGNNAQAADLARAVLIADPTNDRALRVFGLATEQMGRREQGATIMRKAARLGWRDTPTQVWLLRDAAGRNDYTTVLQRADALARRNRMGELTQTVFLVAITDPEWRAAFVDRLAEQPMWRGAFFAAVRQRLPESSIPAIEALYRDMRARKLAISAVEWLSYVDRLIDMGQIQRARGIWAEIANVPQARLAQMPYDSDFALTAARPGDAPASPFEWRLNPDLADAVELKRAGDGGALSLSSDMAGGVTIMSQVLSLSPGEHALSSGVEGRADLAGAGWTITCIPSGFEVPRRLARGSSDELTAAAFTIPASGCAGQRLSLVSLDRLDSESVTLRFVKVR